MSEEPAENSGACPAQCGKPKLSQPAHHSQPYLAPVRAPDEQSAPSPFPQQTMPAHCSSCPHELPRHGLGSSQETEIPSHRAEVSTSTARLRHRKYLGVGMDRLECAGVRVDRLECAGVGMDRLEWAVPSAQHKLWFNKHDLNSPPLTQLLLVRVQSG